MVIKQIFFCFFIFLQHTDHLLNPLVIKNLSINKYLMRQLTNMKFSVTKTKASFFSWIFVFCLTIDFSKLYIMFIA